jgi:type II secretory pathway pseudopilin PulG
MDCPKCGAQVIVAEVPGKRIGKIMIALIFTGIGLVGVCGYVVIPSLIGGIQPGKQKRTVGDMKTIATALESYYSANGHYPAASNIDELCGAIVPSYLVNCIHKDGWHSAQAPSEIAYASWGGSAAGCPIASSSNGQLPSAASSGMESKPVATPSGMPVCGPAHYGLASAGKDGNFAVENFSGYGPRDTDRYEDDIVLMDGQFIRAPVGRQSMSRSGDQYDHPPAAAPEEFIPPSHPRRVKGNY